MRRLAVAFGLVATLAACSADESTSGSSGAGSARHGGQRQDAAPARDTKDAGNAAKPGGLTDVTIGRDVIRTGAMTVRVNDVADAARAAIRTAEQAGGYLEGEQTDDATTALTLRVPPEAFTKTADTLGRLGTVVRREVETEDVTNDVADVAGRLKAARASVERVRALLSRATTLSEVTTLESELNEREAALESLVTRQRSLAGRTAFASLTVTFTKPVLAAPAGPKADLDEATFGSGLDAGWRVFRTVVAILLVVLGAVLPFAGAAALVGIPVYLIRRRATARA